MPVTLTKGGGGYLRTHQQTNEKYRCQRPERPPKLRPPLQISRKKGVAKA